MTTSDLPPVPTDEVSRLEELASYRILDTEAERDLDEIVAVAADISGTPMATITFVDHDRQWFKAKVGLEADETPRAVAFCAHTVMHHSALVVGDTLLDSRFAGNPLVVGAPYLRFYAGFPLLTSAGSAIGTLAVMDRVPRELGTHQRFALQVLAKQVVKWLELRRAVLELEDAVVERDAANDRLGRAQARLEQDAERKSLALEQATREHGRTERLYRTLWETVSDAIVILDRNSVIRYASPSSAGLFRYQPDELVGQPLAMLQPERLRSLHTAGMQRYLATGERRLDWRSSEAIAVTRGGHEVPVEISFSQIELDGDVHFVGVFRDITDRKQGEQRLFEEKERAQATLRAIADGVIVVDEVGVVTFMNPMAETLTDRRCAKAIGQPHSEVLVLEDAEGKSQDLFGPLPDDPEIAVSLMGKNLQVRRPDDTTFAIEGNITQLRDRTGRRAGSVVAFRDVSQWRQLNAQLSYQATHDSLTGLANRSELERRLHVALESAHQSGHAHSLLYLDLDQFKVVNDTCGHIAGDELLRQLGQMLGSNVRSHDTLARLGGDEFGVLLENCPTEPALQIAEKLRQAIAEFPFVWQDHAFNIGVSIGHVCFGDATMNIADVLSKADEACYLAKDLGRNRIHSYQHGDEELARRHGEMEWVGQIRKALKEERFVLYAQQIFNLSDDSCPPHYEILLRMRGEDGRLVPPMSFIPAAERYNLMPTIDRWVISAVCRHLGAQIEIDPEASRACYAINLSGGSVTDAHLAQFALDVLEETGVPGSSICFEITETAAIGNLAHAVKLMQDLKGVGCRFSLDDFGSGMSSFAYLKGLPVDFLKIDGSFIRDIADDPVDCAMVTAIHQIGKLMGLKTVAEFVENDQILAELKRIGVDYGQGYGLAKPEPFL